MAGSFGAALKALREMRGWRPSELAYRAKLKPQTIRMLESGERNDPYSSTLGKLADALGISADDMLIESGMKKQELSNPGLSPAEKEMLEAIRAVNPLALRQQVINTILILVRGAAERDEYEATQGDR